MSYLHGSIIKCYLYPAYLLPMYPDQTTPAPIFHNIFSAFG
jgi:hypothetical protein